MIGPGHDGLDPNDPWHSYHRDPPWADEGTIWGTIATNASHKDWAIDYGILYVVSADGEKVEARVQEVEIKPTREPLVLEMNLVIEVTRRVE